MQLYANDIAFEETRQLLDKQAQQLFPTRWKPSKKRYVSGLPPKLNNKKRRRILYAHMQTLFHRSPKHAANMVLDGGWRDPFTCQPSATRGFNEFWIETFTRPALPDTRPVQEHLPTNNDLIAPVSTEEMKWAQKEMIKSAAGVDRTTARDLQKINHTSLVGICNLPMQAHRQIVTPAEEARESWAQQLFSSADGYGLTESTTYPESHKWLLNPEMALPKLYVQLRRGLLGTKTRHARGRPRVDINCRGGCGQPENLQHILQHCALTHEVRCKRHKDVLKLIANKLRCGILFRRNNLVEINKTW
ncbi:unnamed protein product [Trichobilharzia regenti]|nr:unnamed protein product [Trichobilharzia regenti]